MRNASIDQLITWVRGRERGDDDEPAHVALAGQRSRNVGERAIALFFRLCGYLSILTTVGIVFILFEQAFEFFQAQSFVDFITGTEWTAAFDREYGVLPLVSATLLISAIAMLIAIPFGLGSAIYLAEYARPSVRAIIKPTLEVLAGIPTIVYGFWALTFLTPDVLSWIGIDVRPFNALAAGIAVGIMILPMVASLSDDAIRSVPMSLREGAYAMAATRFEVSTQVVVPAALSGITASAILALSRAIGETMIVAVAAGSRARLSADPRLDMQTMTAFIVQLVGGEAPRGTTRYLSLFAVGALLFIMTLALNIVARWVVRKFREVYE
ncbi:MAG: phosphate ABC transporter permease subunit PstC [Chloroflexota bacterium]|nr:phosphate ABC transporter permease subunit PstC [Chloroflexota bacterium]